MDFVEIIRLRNRCSTYLLTLQQPDADDSILVAVEIK